MSPITAGRGCLTQFREGSVSYCLGPEIRLPLPFGDGFHVRLAEDLRKCVVFIGYPDSTPGRGGITCIGTGFLIGYEGLGHLVTAKHIALDLGRDPFLIRLNKHNGTSQNVTADQVEWHHHPDPTVDVSVVSLHIGQPSPYDATYLESEFLLLSPEQVEIENIGVGNYTYTIGLFRLLSGEKRNMPVCHSGMIAMVPSDEKIPVRDWTDPERNRRIFVEGYLVEAQSLSGLSGSPVFVRPEHIIDISKLYTKSDANPTLRRDEVATHVGCRTQLRLLGLWQGAWEAPPDEVRAVQQGVPPGVQVPVGMGVVVPCNRIKEALDLPALKEKREKINKARETLAAQPQSNVRPVEAPTNTESPSGKEAFNQLLGAAVLPQKKADQT